MQSSMEHYMEIMQKTNIEMARELDKMPIGKFQYDIECSFRLGKWNKKNKWFFH